MRETLKETGNVCDHMWHCFTSYAQKQSYLLAVVLDDFRGHEPLGAPEPLGPRGQGGPADPVVCKLDVDVANLDVLLSERRRQLPNQDVFRL